MFLRPDKILTLFGECKSREVRRPKYRKNVGIDEKNSHNIPRNKHSGSGKKFVKKRRNDSIGVLSKDVDDIVMNTKIRTAAMEFSNLCKIMALSALEAAEEVDAIRHLIESHAPILQQHIFLRYIKTLVRKQYLKQEKESGLNPIFMNFNARSDDSGGRAMRAQLAEMPKEWYIVQVTVAYKKECLSKNNDTVLDSTPHLHITVLPSGNAAAEPFCVSIPSPIRNDNTRYDGVGEILKLLKENKAYLQAYYITNTSYWMMREKQDNKMKIAVKELEYSWLREWRILFMADPSEESKSISELKTMIDKLIADDKSTIKVSPRARWLLKKIATSSCFLTKIEIARAVQYVLSGNEKLANNVILSIYGKLNNVADLRTEKRKTLILIVDESMDHIPFESMDVLTFHPATRFPSFHVAYAMFKEHEDSIIGGCKIVKKSDDFGTFIVNPERNLNKMEKRMKAFIDYWLSEWAGHYGGGLEETAFEQMLIDKDVLIYSGHGSGIQYLPGERIERLRVRAIVFLFGCCSVKLNSVGGRFPPHGVSNQYLIACSPCILGMLWEVTDADIDRMTARFLSDWIPSDVERPWSEVDMNQWRNGLLKFKWNRSSAEMHTTESELLRAVAKAKEVCQQHMTAAAIIVRGLPIRLE